jgi:hypothetical protein
VPVAYFGVRSSPDTRCSSFAARGNVPKGQQDSVLQQEGPQSSLVYSVGFLFSGLSTRVNTNLEQISDWLTKIIVGLGLVQLRSVPDYLYKASVWMAQSFSVDQSKIPASPSTAFLSDLCVMLLFPPRSSASRTYIIRPEC